MGGWFYRFPDNSFWATTFEEGALTWDFRQGGGWRGVTVHHITVTPPFVWIKRIGFPFPGGGLSLHDTRSTATHSFQNRGFAVYHPFRGATDVRVTTPCTGATTVFVKGLAAPHSLSYTSLPSCGKPCAHYSTYVGLYNKVEALRLFFYFVYAMLLIPNPFSPKALRVPT